MARSIGDWYADYEGSSLGDDLDDEIVESQAPWDLRSPGIATTGSDRRSAKFGASKTGSRKRTDSARAARTPAAREAQGSSGSNVGTRRLATARSEINDLPASIRSVAHANPGVGHKRLAAIPRAKGVPATKEQVKEVLATRGKAADLGTRIRRVAKAHPGIGYRTIAAILRANGVPVTKAQVKETLAPARAPSRKGTTARSAARPAIVIRVTAGAQSSRTAHETPLCDSCGDRLSITGMCRCS